MRRRRASRALSVLWPALVLCVSLFAAPQAARAQMVCASAGNDGPPAGALTNVVNTYYPGTADANAGAVSISVGTPRGAAATIASGDLLLVIQMQDAAIDPRNNTRYGDGANNGTPIGGWTNLNSAGLYEYVVATSAAGATVSIKGTGTGNGLRNAYHRSAATSTQGQRTFQVIRVPQYSSATLSSSLTAAVWDGSTGGVLAIDVAGTLTLSGTVSVDGKGFRGGGARQLAGNGTGSSNDYAASSATVSAHGMKGEGIAGTPHYVYDGTSVVDTLPAADDGYPIGTTNPTGGSLGRGAPANGGGGGTDGNPAGSPGNDQNSGGGGGGNGGAGGQGGHTWSGDADLGGFGGFSLVASLSATRVYMGGGGGAGTRNNSATVASSGAAGGGIIMIRAGTITGAGTLSANGANAYNLTDNDGGGGGGAGGSIVVAATNVSGSLTMLARGGRGGDAWNSKVNASGTPGDRHGPGGGGGGGFIAYPSSITGPAASATSGGANGVTLTLADAYGATPGNAGTTLPIALTDIPGASAGTQCVPNLTVTKTTSTPSVRNTQTGVAATYTITVANAANLSAATNVTLSDTLPSLFTYASTGPINFTGGAARSSPTDPTVGDAVPAWSLFKIPGGGSVALTFTVNIAYNAVGTYQNPATATYLDPKRTTNGGTTTASYNSASSTGEDVTVTGVPFIQLDKSCTSPANCMDPTATQTPGTELTYSITFTNNGGASASSFVIYDMIPANTVFKVGSVTYNANGSGIAAPTVDYSQQPRSGATPPVPPAPWTNYTPTGTFDANVKWIRWTFGSPIPAGKSASVSFTVRIN